MYVPGSIGELLTGVPTQHPFSWYAIVREKSGAKKQWTYWMNGSQSTREDIAVHIATHFPNVDVVTIDRCTKMPDKMLEAVPPHHFQNPKIILLPDGTAAARDEIQDQTLTRPRPLLSAKPLISLQPLSQRKPLWHPPH